jgi:rhomboid family GlyGly-CTERM serine protease
MKKIPFLTLGLGAFALFVFLHQGWSEALEFSRTALARGELWRLFTGHLMHFSADHLQWDLVVFVALGSLVELRNRSHFVSSVAGSALAISLGVWWLQPQFASYRGLSGVDSALFGYLAVDILNLSRGEGRRLPALAGGLAMTLFVAKIIFELSTGRTIFVENNAGFTPVPLAHLIGVIVGGAVVYRSQLTAAFILRKASARVARGQPRLMRTYFPRGVPKNAPSDRPTPYFSKCAMGSARPSVSTLSQAR